MAMQLRSKNAMGLLVNQRSLVKKKRGRPRKLSYSTNLGKPVETNLSLNVISISTSSEDSFDISKICQSVSNRKGIIIPQYTRLPKITRDRNQNSWLRKGYYRYVGRTYPPRNLIQLTDSDLFFIQSNAKQFQFYSFRLLNDYLLLQVYNLAYNYKTTGIEPSQIQTRIQKHLIDPEHQIFSPVYVALKLEEPETFDKLTKKFMERWLQHSKKGINFQKNCNNNVYFKLYRQRQFNNQSFRKKPTNIYNKYYRLNRQTQGVQKYLSQYQKVSEQLQDRKVTFFNQLSSLFKVLKHIQFLPQYISDPIKGQLQLAQVQKIVKRLISQIKLSEISSESQQAQPTVKREFFEKTNLQSQYYYKSSNASQAQ